MYQSVALRAVRGGTRSAAGAAANTTAAASALPSSVLQKRTLVSSVLLGRDAYDGKRVADLKGELKQRGLATSGKRNQLIQRLLENDELKAKVLPQSSASPSSPSHVRHATTQASPAPQQDGLSIDPADASVGTSTDKATISHPPDIEPGSVSSNSIGSTEEGLRQTQVLEAAAIAPGVPPGKAARVPIVFDVKIPYEKIEKDGGPEIPLMTAYFHPESPMYQGPPSTEEGPQVRLPKVITTSGEETYPGGGPSHHHGDFDAESTSSDKDVSSNSGEESGHTVSSAISSMINTMRDDLGFKVDPATEKKAVETAKGSVETTRSLLKDARDSLSARLGSSSSTTSSGSGSSSASYSTSSYSGGTTRPLNDDERRGLYVLGGIVATGFLLGGLGKPSKRRVEKVKKHIAEEVQEVKKASSAVSDDELSALVAKAESVLKSA